MRKMVFSNIVLIIFAVFLINFKTTYAQVNNITLATVKWAPYFSPELKENGFLVEVCKEAFKRAGFKMKLHFMPWNRALMLSKKGFIDGLLGAYFNEARKKQYYFSVPIGKATTVLITQKNSQISTNYNKLINLKKYTFGVGRGWIYSDKFDNASYLKKEETKDVQQLIRMLIENRVDIIIIAKKVFQHEVKINYHYMKNDFKYLHPAINKSILYIAFSKKTPGAKEICLKFNKAFKSLQNYGTIKKILIKHGF